MQEDDDGNGLTLGRTDVAAVLRATWEILPGESIRFQYTDQSDPLGHIFECEFCLHVSFCQPQGPKTMLKKLAAVQKQSFPATKTPKIGALVIVNTRGIAQQWRVSNIKTATVTLVTIKFENNEMTVDKGWFMFHANSGSLLLSDSVSLGRWLSNALKPHMKSGETISTQRR